MERLLRTLRCIKLLDYAIRAIACDLNVLVEH
jgi:hypothetical protein